MKLLEPFNIDLRGINLVEASAGTGKTYNITSLYIRAIIEQDIPVSKILVVTYTEAATKELKDRLLERIRLSIRTLKKGMPAKEEDDFLQSLLNEVEHPQKAVEKLEQAVRTFDEAAVYTIHGFCYQALQEQAFESRAMYDAEMIGDDQELVQEAVDDYWRNWVATVSGDSHRQLLHQLLIDDGVEPNSLAHKLGTYTGKPYLKILPEEVLSFNEIQQRLDELADVFEQMRATWSQEREQIIALLLADKMNGRKYRSDHLANWSGYMTDFLDAGFESIKPFKQFENFTTSVVSENLKSGYDTPPEHVFFDQAEKYQQLFKLVSSFSISFKKKLLEYLYKELDQKKEQLQVLSYDDLLLRLRNALCNGNNGATLASKLRQKYPIAMVDEFQDTDPNQYDIFRAIYKNTNSALFMIGDPKQSIYSFRGADVYSYIKARKDAPSQKRFKLDRNFRSTPKLLQGLNAFWGSHDDPFAVDDDIEYKEVSWGRDESDYKQLTEYGEERPPIRFRRLSKMGQDPSNKPEARKKVAYDTAKEIKRLLEGGEAGEYPAWFKSSKGKRYCCAREKAQAGRFD